MAFGINVERLIVAARSLTGSHASEDSRIWLRRSTERVVV
jgi:hypothetical protein